MINPPKCASANLDFITIKFINNAFKNARMDFILIQSRRNVRSLQVLLFKNVIKIKMCM
jgi:hypothetical protein